VTPYYQDEAVTLYHGDSREVLPTLPTDAAIVSDPPYGMNWNTDSTRFTGGARRLADGVKRAPVHGDKEPFDPSPFIAYPACVLFGLNHFAQRVPVGTWLIWTKKPAARYGSFLSDAEVAWMKGGHGVYLREFQWEGLNRQEERGAHYHPTQKPVAIMRWCIEMGGGY
jgi:site-specific DNA-methyltransferase (adenine-specific)